MVKIPAFIPDLIRFLDNVLTFFIENAPNELERAKYSASRERSIGLGAMGFHAYLQKNNLPFEGMWASAKNMQMFKHIKEQAQRETQRLAAERGACPDDDSCQEEMHIYWQLLLTQVVLLYVEILVLV